MTRTSIPREIEEQVLVLSRRRCSLCFGLHRDTGIKHGQIAHLDHDASHHGLDNLVFLCLEHHDQYDSTTAQSKGITIREVRRFRTELYDVIAVAWKQPITVGNVIVCSPSDISGHYVWETSNASAELDVTLTTTGRVRVCGLALWGTRSEYGPNLGQLDFEAPLQANCVTFRDKRGDSEYLLQLQFGTGAITATEHVALGYFGMNVTFEGSYLRVEAEAVTHRLR